MENMKKNTNEDAIKALGNSMKIIESLTAGDENKGACVWVTPSGKSFCAQLTPADCARIDGAIYVGGDCPKP